MVGGQFMDVAGLAADDDDLRLLHALKTGRLIEAAVVCGALLGGAEDLDRRIVRSPPISVCSSRSSTTSSTRTATRPSSARAWARIELRTR